MKIRPVGDKRDGQTDMTTLVVAFRNFANAPKNNLYLCDQDVQVRLRYSK
jgi:hypothetical protein